MQGEDFKEPATPPGKSSPPRVLLLAIVCLITPIAQAANQSPTTQNLTKFTPDIVFECESADPQYIGVAGCGMGCFERQGSPSNAPIKSLPEIYFTRIEFFSKPGRESERWMVAILGTRGAPSPDKSNLETMYLTMGDGHSCIYVPGAPFTPIPNATFKPVMTKYY